jgi:peptide/nickel transport system permease protein
VQYYLIRRLTLFAPTLFLVTVLIFIILRVLPGNVAVLVLAGPGGENRFSQADVKRVEHQLHLDKPIPVQYAEWVGGALKLDFGKSVIQSSPVASQVFQRFLRCTWELTVLTVIFSLIIALPLGVLQAVKQNSFTDYVLRLITIGGIAIPGFVSGTLVIIVAVRYFHWLPPIQYRTLWADPATNLKQMILPSLVLGYGFAAAIARLVRSAMLEVLRYDHVRTARAKGLAERTVLVRHALRNSLLPVITIIGGQVGALLGGTAIAEQLFNLPGVGSAAVQAIQNRDYPLLQFIVLLFALVFMITNLLVDLSYAWIDPRVRYG